MAIDYSDDTQVLNLLRAAYYTLLAGGKPQTVEVPTAGGGMRRITYHQTDLALLAEEVRRLEAKTSAAAGTVKRHCILAG